MPATKTKETWTISFDPMSTYAQALFQALCLSKQFQVERSPYVENCGAKRKPAKTVSSAEKRTLKAIEELDRGEGTVCHSFEDYLKAVV